MTRRPDKALWTQVSSNGIQWPARVWIDGHQLTVTRLWPRAKARVCDLRGARIERWVFGLNLFLKDDEIRFTVPSRRLCRLLIAHGATEFGQDSS